MKDPYPMRFKLRQELQTHATWPFPLHLCLEQRTARATVTFRKCGTYIHWTKSNCRPTSRSFYYYASPACLLLRCNADNHMPIRDYAIYHKLLKNHHICHVHTTYRPAVSPPMRPAHARTVSNSCRYLYRRTFKGSLAKSQCQENQTAKAIE